MKIGRYFVFLVALSMGWNASALAQGGNASYSTTGTGTAGGLSIITGAGTTSGINTTAGLVGTPGSAGTLGTLDTPVPPNSTLNNNATTPNYAGVSGNASGYVPVGNNGAYGNPVTLVNPASSGDTTGTFSNF